jgi:uncharacterized protein
MKKKVVRVCGWLALLIAVGLILLPSRNADAKSNKWVNDHANVLSAKTMRQVDQLSETGWSKLPGHPRLVVETYYKLPHGDSIDEFKAKRFEELGIGEKGWDNGLYFVIGLNSRKYGLEVGYGLEAAMPDGAMRNIITSAVKQDLKAKRYDAATSLIVTNIDHQMRTHKSAILTPTGIEGKRAAHKRTVIIVSSVLGGLVLIVLLWLLWFTLRHARRQEALVRAVKSDRELTGDMTLLNSLPAKEQKRFFDSLKAPWIGPLEIKQQVHEDFATYVKDHFVKLLKRNHTDTKYPLYVYGVTTLRCPTYKLIAMHDLFAVAEFANEQVSRHYDDYGLYTDNFEAWSKKKNLSVTRQAEVWAEFISNVRKKDAAKLTPKNQVRTFNAILHFIEHPDKELNPGSDLPLWVAASYTGSASSSGGGDSFGSGSGFGGGSSGGGGFSGGW